MRFRSKAACPVHAAIATTHSRHVRKSGSRGGGARREREREREVGYIYRAHACDYIGINGSQRAPALSRLLSIHARRRPIVRRVDNFKTMPTGPAAHCAKITGTPSEKRAKEERKKRERMRIARGRAEGGEKGGWMTARALLSCYY